MCSVTKTGSRAAFFTKKNLLVFAYLSLSGTKEPLLDHIIRVSSIKVLKRVALMNCLCETTSSCDEQHLCVQFYNVNSQNNVVYEASISTTNTNPSSSLTSCVPRALLNAPEKANICKVGIIMSLA